MLLVIGSMFCTSILSCGPKNNIEIVETPSDLVFDKLAQKWDEGIPLGNAFVGALVWQKGENIRFSLDRVDLWDLRKVENFKGDNFSFEWVKEQIRKNNYGEVQKLFDRQYSKNPFPSKIPGGALEIPMKEMGEVKDVYLYVENGVCEVIWENDVRMKTFVDANMPLGWFVFDGIKEEFSPVLLSPKYEDVEMTSTVGSHSMQDLKRLGYKQGEIKQIDNNMITYHQVGADGFYYDIAVKWEKQGDQVVGVWSVTSSLGKDGKALDLVVHAMEEGIDKRYLEHNKFWEEYNDRSSICIPNKILQKQYDNEMYKFGCVTRAHSYPISLQAIWTADNGKLPPWKGDYHHDLNTQLSAWPMYIGNRLDYGMGYINTLWEQRCRNKQFTKRYFDTDGLNVPGVATLTGDPMGGWIQYSLSVTTSAWLAHHFYLHWIYSADDDFLRERGYPYLKDVAIHLEQMTYINKKGERTLEYSSSPEINDNRVEAWFTDITNYDLALIKFAFNAASEMAERLKLDNESSHWKRLSSELPAFDLDKDGGLTFAKNHPYNSSHRHFSHAMAFHPLGILDWSQGEESQKTIKATIDKLDQYGGDWWTGYSYSWLGNMKARVFDGEGAEEALETFAKCFCLKSGFHANGDQSGTGKSKFTYRPFTLEGNFAFASGVQEMLLQSHTDTIVIFPAIPADWKEVSFHNLRAKGAFLISARKKDGEIVKISVTAEKGGTTNLRILVDSLEECNLKPQIEDAKSKVLHYLCDNNIIQISLQLKKGETISLTNE